MTEDVSDINELTGSPQEELGDIPKTPENIPPVNAKSEALMQSVFDSVENPTPENSDPEGAALFMEIKSSFKKAAEGTGGKKSEIGNVLYAYKTASEATGSMDRMGNTESGSDAADVNKAVIALSDFHKQLGLGEYKVDISGAFDSDEYKEREEKYRSELEKKILGCCRTPVGGSTDKE